jgi:hypothetical protein
MPETAAPTRRTSGNAEAHTGDIDPTPILEGRRSPRRCPMRARNRLRRTSMAALVAGLWLVVAGAVPAAEAADGFKRDLYFSAGYARSTAERAPPPRPR